MLISACCATAVAPREALYVLVRERLCPNGVLRPGLAVIVDGQVGRFGLLEAAGPDSEVHFLPAIAGG
jgi:sulfur-carrier protein